MSAYLTCSPWMLSNPGDLPQLILLHVIDSLTSSNVNLSNARQLSFSSKCYGFMMSLKKNHKTTGIYIFFSIVRFCIFFAEDTKFTFAFIDRDSCRAK